jgi:RNA-splicing ligase RtcB
MDGPQLREQVELVRKAVWEGIGQLTGRAENTVADGVGLDLRLKWSHNELKQIRSSVQSIASGVLVIAVAVVASVWHHW